MAAGIIEANRTGGNVKRIHCGWAAQSAVNAVSLARHGITGPPSVLEGRFGFFQAWLHSVPDTAQVVAGLGTDWTVPEIFFKPYPANHFTHCVVDAAANLRRRGVTPGQIESIEVGVPSPNVRTIGEPLEVKQAPATGYMAQFSGPYAVAAGLLGGGGLEVNLDDYTDELAIAADRVEIMRKVTIVGDEEMDAIFPYQFPARLTARLKDGTTCEEKVLANRGGGQRPLSQEEIVAKYRDCASRVISAEQTEGIMALCLELDAADSLRSLMSALRHAEANPPNGGIFATDS